jgi:Fe-S cluster biogenesis protein NfuA
MGTGICSFLIPKKRLAISHPSAPQVVDALKDAQDYARSHGGRIDLVDITPQGEVKVRLKGSCAFCPFAKITLRLRVEKVLVDNIPGITKVSVVR